MVHSKAYSNVQKFHYLNSCLVGEAAKVIRGFQVTDANYEVAWQTLCARYNNDRLIVFSLLGELFESPLLRAESNVGLRALVDTVREVFRQLMMMGVPVDKWDVILVYIVAQRLDSHTRRAWELTQTSPELPELEDLLSFLECRARSLDNMPSNTQATPAAPQARPRGGSSPSRGRQRASNVAHVAPVDPCPMCSEAHLLHRCDRFKDLPLAARYDKVKEWQVCFGCFKSGHTAPSCKNTRPCRLCPNGVRHNTWLCPKIEKGANVSTVVGSAINAPGTSQSETAPPRPLQAETSQMEVEVVQGSVIEPLAQESPSRPKLVVAKAVGRSPELDSVLLGTAVVRVQCPDGMHRQVRALCDPGAQISLITEDCTQRLQLPRRTSKLTIHGVGSGLSQVAHGMVTLEIMPRFTSDFRLTVQAYILSRVTRMLPTTSIQTEWDHLTDLGLADPLYGKSQPVDVLLGVDAWSEILMGEVRRGPVGSPIASQTRLGWVVFGPLRSTGPSQSVSVNFVIHEQLEESLRRFWELEEPPTSRSPVRSRLGQMVEDLFISTYRRDDDGRYIVRIPFDDSVRTLGASRHIALRRLEAVKRRLQAQPEAWAKYQSFMAEYLELGHMRVVPPLDGADRRGEACYIPHHAVTTGKFRVVFDASCPTSSGKSLNDVQLVGDKLQDDLRELLVRFRYHRVALTADVTKMYRQVRVAEDQLDFQRILWERQAGVVEEFQLTTVTYGMSSAPYCAVRALRQCAVDHQKDYPLGSEAVLRDFYVDDLLSGADSELDALEVYSEVSKLLNAGGFQLRKWSTNSTFVFGQFEDGAVDDRGALEIGEQGVQSVLGVLWYPARDEFGFHVDSLPDNPAPTKRSMLSEIARLYDPSGHVAPTIVLAKICLQECWKLGLAWDQELPRNLGETWERLRGSLQELSKVRVPRWLGTGRYYRLQLHGFCDASNRAYGAVVYARSENELGMVKCTLIASRSKVAPVKVISTPRLELCGAHMLAKLLHFIKGALNTPIVEQYCWSDSTIVLHWVRKLPSSLKTFVANRVTQIVEVTSPSEWRHVRTRDNPADHLSRGLFPAELVKDKLWWEGPSWLAKPQNEWPANSPHLAEDEASIAEGESRREAVIHVIATPTCLEGPCGARRIPLVDRYSRLTRLVRVTAYVFRWINRVRKRSREQSSDLTPSEMWSALRYWVRHEQRLNYGQEMECCNAGSELPRRSTLLALNPFVDDEGTLRVGGRLGKSDEPEDVKHQMILPAKSFLTTLIFRRSHERTLHGGVQLMLQQLRQVYWVVGARRAVRSFIHSCLPCFRQKRSTAQQLMGELPRQRVEPCRPFYRAGVDYCGPFQYLIVRGRGRTTMKGYVVVFVCLATKAIHLDLVSDLSSDAFLAAFRRMISRRGACSELLSDNATTFVGAKRQLDEVYASWQKQELIATLATEGTKWGFIPPAAPHQGGLWEAGVKSAKHHLTRVIGSHILTYEEMVTLLTQVEACLNSRPLTALSDDPNDMQALTPGHFLIGEPIIAMPDRDLTELPIGRIGRWELAQRLQQQFWKRWRLEYIAQLQQRPKWRQQRDNIQVGMMVIIKDDLLPPTQWSLARITRVHYGQDGLVRSVDLRTAASTFTRPITKVCVLPFEKEQHPARMPEWGDCSSVSGGLEPDGF